MYIGKKLKEIRKLREMTLSELSEASGVQLATLSRIENMKMTGTLESHIQIAKALNVELTDLYSEIVKPEDRVSVKTTETDIDVYVDGNKSSYELLTSNVLSKQMMPTLIKIAKAGKTSLEENKIGSEKFIYVLSGKVTVHIGKEHFKLTEKNTLYFKASVPHFYANTGNSGAEILCVTTPATL